jgi:hypothetical protein
VPPLVCSLSPLRFAAALLLSTNADGAIENLLSTFHASLGYYSSAAVYYSIAPGAFLTPYIVGKLGPQLAMGIGALTYSLVSVKTNLLPVTSR